MIGIELEMVRIPFGKHRGTPLSEMDPGYLRWMLKKAKSADAWDGLVQFVSQNSDYINEILDPRVRVQKIKVDYQLSQSQAAASDGIEQTLLMGEASMMRLEGGAGYGKSFTVLDVVRKAMHHGYEVHACATSYVATQVLCKHLEAYGIEPKTIASLLRLDKIEFEDQESYEAGENTPEALATIVGSGHLLIVDEYSMVNDEIAEMMMERANALGGKILAVGDLKQLPPVKQDTDSVFSKIPDAVTLTDPMRYSPESDLFQLEQIARNTPHAILRTDWSEMPAITVHPDTGAMISRYVDDYEADSGADSRMLFFRRADVIETNAIIRRSLFGANRAMAEPIIEDEALMVTSTTDIKTSADLDDEAPGSRYYSGTSFRVDSVHEGVVEGVPCYVVTFDGQSVPVPVLFGMGQVLDQESLGAGEYRQRIGELRDEAIETGYWKPWRQFKNRFLPVSHRYATTVHRAQGATVDRVYFAPSRLTGGAMTEKLLYVAATRAREAVHIAKGG